MTSPYRGFYDYLAEHVITPFYGVRLKGLHGLKLAAILKRKNPYLFKAKNIELAGDLVKGIVIAPIDREARQKDETFKKAYAAKVNEMTQDFTNNFMTPENQIDWLKLIDYVSSRQ